MTSAASILALSVSILSFLLILYLLTRRLSNENLKKIYSESLKNTLSDTQIVKDQFKASVAELKIDAEIRAINQSTDNISKQQQSLTDIFTNRSSRGYFGERQLEDILKDHFGPDSIHVREKISSDIQIPDFNFDTPQGKLCVDSKFPLENYQRIIGASQDKERSASENDFKRDFTKHMKKVAEYVKPESGTARIALMYIPAESIYAYIAENHPEWMEDASKENVLIVSPSTIIPQLAVIRSYVEAEKIVKHTDAIKRKIEGYQREFNDIEKEWRTLRGHIDNTKLRSLSLNEKLELFGPHLNTLITGLSNEDQESQLKQGN